MKSKIEKKTYNKKRLSPEKGVLDEQSGNSPAKGVVNFGSDHIEGLKRTAMEAEAKYANKKAIMEKERLQLLAKIEKLKERDRVRQNLRQTNNPLMGGDSRTEASSRGQTMFSVQLKENSQSKATLNSSIHGPRTVIKKFEPVRTSSRRGSR